MRRDTIQEPDVQIERAIAGLIERGAVRLETSASRLAIGVRRRFNTPAQPTDPEA